MAWANWNLKDAPAIQTLDTVGSAVAPIIDTMASLLEIVKSVVELVSKLVLDVPDLETAAIKAAIETVRAILKDLVGDAGCYFLPIPVHLKNVLPEGTLVFDPSPGVAEGADGAVMLPPVGGGGGGNYGFLYDLIRSLNDENDVLRPQFDEDAHIAGLVVVAGADSFLDILPLIEKLKRLFAGKKKGGAGEGIGGTDGATIPKAKSLRAEIVPSVVGQLQKLNNRLEGGGATHPYAVKLSWDLPERITVISAPPNKYTFTIQSIYVYRSEIPISVYANPTNLAERYKIKEFEFDGLTNTFYDDTIELNKNYYYAVGFKNSARWDRLEGGSYVEKNSAVYEPGADAVINVPIPNEINLMPRSGVPPDWLLFPNPLALIPDLVEVVNSVNVFLDTLEARLDTASDKYEKFIAALTKEINRYIKLAEDVIETIQNIVDLLSFPDVYIGAYPFSGKGGNGKLVNIIGTALTDTNDPDRPPFDRGDEVLTGFVLYAGSATVGKLEAFVSFIEMLIGQTTSSAASAYAEAAADIGTAVDEIESQIYLLENLERGEAPDTGTERENLVNLGPDLEPAAEEDESVGCS